MKRRLFLQMFGGVAAAPAVIKPTIPIGSLSGAALTSGVGMAADALEPESSGVIGKQPDRLKRLSQLRRLILGTEVEEEEGWSIGQRKKAIAETQLNALKSVSQAAKMRMLYKEVVKIRLETDRIGWYQSYKRLKSGGEW